MGAGDLSSLLEGYKRREDAAGLATIIDSPEAIRVLSAWPTIRVKWQKASGHKAKDLKLRWPWLWRGVSFDIDDLARAARLGIDQAYSLLRVLVAARAVYPDGTISGPASELVTAYVEKRLAMHAPKAKTKARERGHLEGPRARACPQCGARAGEACKLKTGKHYKRKFFHKARKDLSNDG